ncbi:hypothetical protein [Lentilactobacillus sp. SPB1-3]|uniref:Uncharacterized protein n=1 Tax=Lentilactobacillus terminaliae TaxID=3003483 RepID=A0ACD5DCV0_9LACO|nr:hypothetical protein [Lentilactobacillus sp. SPB1-3]MCZ0978135.1 hypothetical protein [Lentilactobacillus sp. SPB1-3]
MDLDMTVKLGDYDSHSGMKHIEVIIGGFFGGYLDQRSENGPWYFTANKNVSYGPYIAWKNGDLQKPVKLSKSGKKSLEMIQEAVNKPDYGLIGKQTGIIGGTLFNK